MHILVGTYIEIPYPTLWLFRLLISSLHRASKLFPASQKHDIVSFPTMGMICRHEISVLIRYMKSPAFWLTS